MKHAERMPIASDMLQRLQADHQVPWLDHVSGGVVEVDPPEADIGQVTTACGPEQATINLVPSRTPRQGQGPLPPEMGDDEPVRTTQINEQTPVRQVEPVQEFAEPGKARPVH